MLKPFKLAAAATFFGLALGFAASDRGPISQAQAEPKQHRQQQQSHHQRPAQEGEASYYGSEFNGRPMANGERFSPGSNSAAHRSLPLGTTAQVTNLENGRSATVKVEDRGPYARNRVIDVSPRVAEELGMRRAGRAPVRVTPVEVPERDERSRRGEGRQARR